jgi:hypothetical protein
MRHLLTRLAAAAFVVGLAFGLSPASAAPLPKIDSIAGQTTGPVVDVGYRYRHGWRPYRYGYRGWGYRPYYGYGYGYRYGYRPYYRPYWRYWW